ncbi:hypothetical protein J2T14_000075 [Paenibacillus harenae]|nr:hypothetical protein [Paenibacillus harenae]
MVPPLFDQADEQRLASALIAEMVLMVSVNGDKTVPYTVPMD